MAINFNTVTATDNTTDMAASSQSVNDKPLRESVQLALSNYFNQLEGYDPVNLYEMVLEEVEIPLFTAIMLYAKRNQSRAALLLGISRSTLRKKLQQYNLFAEKKAQS